MMEDKTFDLLTWLLGVQRFRCVMEDKSSWVTPSELNCLRLAVAKAGKALDAWVADTQDMVLTNVDERYQTLSYLASCAIMLATPLSTIKITWLEDPWPLSSDIDKVVLSSFYTLSSYKTSLIVPEYVNDYRERAIHTIKLIWTYPEMDLPKRTREYFSIIGLRHRARG